MTVMQEWLLAGAHVWLVCGVCVGRWLGPCICIVLIGIAAAAAATIPLTGWAAAQCQLLWRVELQCIALSACTSNDAAAATASM